MNKISSLLTASLTIVALASSSSLLAQSSSVADFYRDNTVQVLVGYSPGGGYDTYARVLARHIGKHIPGNPNIVVRNVPGAGSLVLMNQLANTLPADGTAFGTVNSGMAYEPLFGNEQAQFNTLEMNWIGNLNVEVALGIARSDSGISDIRDLRNSSISMGSTGAGAQSNFMPRILAELFDLNVSVVSGYPGASEVNLAMERGEVQGVGTLLLSTVARGNPEWLQPGSDYNLIYQIASEAHELTSNVTLAHELAETEEQRQVLDLLVATLTMGRPFVAPPGVPQERVDALRQAMADTANDPEFVNELVNTQRLMLGFVHGAEMQDYFADVYQTPQNIVDFVVNAMNR